MQRVRHVLELLGTKLGQHYDLHEQAPLWDSGWNGPWNCSSFLAWGLWQTGDYRSLGCRPYSPPGHHATFPRWWKLGRIWAWTEWFYEDLEDCAQPISEAIAARTPGAIALYRPCESYHGVGHIAVSLGRNRIIEAHGAGSGPTGVIASRSLTNLGFQHFYLLPGYRSQASHWRHCHHRHQYLHR
jgi:hypothetical protein